MKYNGGRFNERFSSKIYNQYKNVLSDKYEIDEMVVESVRGGVEVSYSILKGQFLNKDSRRVLVHVQGGGDIIYTYNFGVSHKSFPIVTQLRELGVKRVLALVKHHLDWAKDMLKNIEDYVNES
jgi:hypothetical protein